jgi:Cys-rich protein (TIGR01571 family)
MSQTIPFRLCLASVAALQLCHASHVSQSLSAAAHGASAQKIGDTSTALRAFGSGFGAQLRPLPVVNHTKTPGGGYTDGSTFYRRQQTWVKKNGDNSIRPPQETPFTIVPWPWRLAWETAYLWPLTTTMVFVLTLALWLGVAQLYLTFKSRAVEPWTFEQKSSSVRESGFKYGFFACCCAQDGVRHASIFASAFLCPALRWADTVSTMESLDRKRPFWKFHALFLSLCILAPLTLGVSLLPLACLGVNYRQRMRTRYHQAAPEVGALLCDTCVWLCLPCFAIAQEAREVEEVSLPNEDV